jgi:hypothetical protein
MTRLDAAEYERAITWNLTIAAELFGKDVKPRDEGKERYFTETFHICRQSGAWYDWGASKGGLYTIPMIRFIRPSYTNEDAERWLAKFLAAHKGVGSLEPQDVEWTQTRQAATAELARHYLDTAVPLPLDSPGAVYLTSRGLLSGPYPETLRWLPNARPGEGALVMRWLAAAGSPEYWRPVSMYSRRSRSSSLFAAGSISRNAPAR